MNALKLFPRSYLEKDSLDFSFSGLKSAIKRYVDSSEILTDEKIQMIAYATESAIIEVLVHKLFLAAEIYELRNICLAG